MVARKHTDEELVSAVEEQGSQDKAAKALGINRRTLERRLARMKAKGSGGDYESTLGYRIENPVFGKTTVQTDAHGNVEREWHRFSRESQNVSRLLESFAEGLAERIEPSKPAKLPKKKGYIEDLLTGVFVGDAHIGMYAYGPETSHSDFDTNIATQQLRDAIDYLVERAEPTETGLLVDVGDLMHANSQHNQTFSGTPVDVDTRHHLVMEKAAQVLIYMIEKMKQKHRRVVVCIARGNHNTDVAPAIQLMISFYYHQDERVQVLKTEGHYHYIEYGKWLLGVHHGDKQKPEALAASMARDMSQAWGRTHHRMWCTGHYHKDALKTLPGVKHKIFGALPPPDSWHASKGFMGDGEMEMLTFRKSGGLHSSHMYNIPRPIIEPDVKL